jgi:putative nucleotidyltransferase with HDIG domain
MPTVGLELMRLLRQPFQDIEVEAVAQLVEKDPSLSARLISLSNSPYYATTRTITRIKQAIVSVGLDETIGVLSYFTVRGLFPKIPKLSFFNPDEFWSHCLASAQIARMLGHTRYLTQCLPGELYLAGLLHDVGRLMMVIHLPDEYQRCLEYANQHSIPLEQIEHSALGVDHAVVGAHLLNDWHFPDKILDAVAFHHDPSMATETNRQMTALIELADLIAVENGFGLSGNLYHKPPAEAWIRSDALSPLSNDETWATMLQDIQIAVQEEMAAMKDPLKTSAAAQSRRKVGSSLQPKQTPQKTGAWSRLLALLGF